MLPVKLTTIIASAIFRYMGLKFGKIGEKLKKTIGKFGKEKPREPEPVETVSAPKLSDEAYSLLKKLYEELGPRPAASLSSKNAARKISVVFESFTEDVSVTTGKIVPQINRWMLISAIVCSAVVFIFTLIGLPYISLIAGILFILSFCNELRMGENPLRSLFPSSEATNVHAVIEPDGVVEHTIVFSAHHDSAPISKKVGDGIFKKLSLQTGCVGFIVLVFLSFVETAVELFTSRLLLPGFIGWIMALFVFLSFALSLFSMLGPLFTDGSYTAGAGDNLSGVSIVATLAEYFSMKRREGKGLSSTRLVFASFDGEECGAAGSRIWYQENANILVNPVNLNFDGIYKLEDLAFLSSDGNGFISLSSSLASKCSQIASEMGYKVQTGKLGFLGGATDAASAATFGIKATTLTSMVQSEDCPAHTAEDTPDKVSPEALSVAMSIAIKLAEDIDRKEEGNKEREGLLDGERKYRLSRY